MEHLIELHWNEEWGEDFITYDPMDIDDAHCLTDNIQYLCRHGIEFTQTYYLNGKRVWSLWFRNEEE